MPFHQTEFSACRRITALQETSQRFKNRRKRQRPSFCNIRKAVFHNAANLRGTNRTGRLLVDSGSSLDLIKEMLMHLENPREDVTKVFSMENDKHTTSEITKLKFPGKDNVFDIVPNDIPLPEDGIIGIPFIHSYKFSLLNTYSELDGVKHKLHDDGIFVPMNSILIISM